MSQPVRVFLSYSHKDEDLKDRLCTHLRSLERIGLLSTWHDRRIGPGQDWRQEIEQNLAGADVILLLVSADFMDSDFCYLDEMTKALERHNRREAVVVPVILRACQWQRSPLAALQALPRDGRAISDGDNEDNALDSVAGALATMIEGWQRPAGPALPPAPVTTGTKVWLVEIDGSEAPVLATYASGELIAASQDARPGEGLRALFSLRFGDHPGAGLPPLRRVQVTVDLPAGCQATDVIGRETDFESSSGIAIGHIPGKRRRPRWHVRAVDEEALHGRRIAPDDIPLLRVPEARKGQTVAFRIEAFPNQSCLLGSSVPASDKAQAKQDALRERIIDRLNLKALQNPDDDGAIVLWRQDNDVYELDE